MSRNSWVYLNKFIDMKIEKLEKHKKMFLVEVVESTGYYVDVKFATDETGLQIFQGIPVIQSKYANVITQPQDIGILLNLEQRIDAFLEGKPQSSILESDYFVFLPLLTKQEYQLTPDKQRLTSPDLQTSLIIGNDGFTITAVESLNIEGSSVTIKSSDPISLGTGTELGAVLAELIDVLSSATTTPASPGAPCALDPGIVSQLNDIKSKLAEVLKS